MDNKTPNTLSALETIAFEIAELRRSLDESNKIQYDAVCALRKLVGTPLTGYERRRMGYDE